MKLKHILKEENYLSNQVFTNIKTIDTNDKDEMLGNAVKWAKTLIKNKLGINLKFNIKWGESSFTFDNSIEIRFKNPYHFKYPEEFYDTVLHELCHVIDNSFGTTGKFGGSNSISTSKEWSAIPIGTAPTSYAKDSKDEDFVISLQFALYGRLNQLTKDRQDFLIDKFPKLK